MATPKDTQVVELAGRHWLIGHLLSSGFEVANPVRDRGVDLLVYEERSDAFRAVPVQVKASSYRGFSVHDKYHKARGLVLAFVWDVRPEAERTSAYILTVAEAEEVAGQMGWARAGKLAYSTTAPSKKLILALEPFLSTPDRWRTVLGSTGGKGKAES